ncbi:phytoene/squalene synthase family protein [Maritimibacter sp. UBA3975]|uniref:15-cis-phytoene synthase n=1 Tax=Maritimibacter sp. UBA3975 TaxID=1946833 RepID=UPI000C0A58F9|nr:phytoene/squalene synthase family protein [Maritimibacter sp. UBA3975]MAM62935.1 phytoene synthase [Maritimibacter sp.]|tara:strand:+ start:47253 stop:48299 length:1047 start_codon:yes stop_codon:yes gene_type:complete
MIDQSDLDYCAGAIRHGSRSFHAASRVLPRSLRDPALALYAFCRCADDAVDLNDSKAQAVASLRTRLDLCYEGRPRNAPEDRAFTGIIETFDMPRALPEALLEGFEWDAESREYRSLADLRAYAARVAATVGAMMCVLMGVRDADALARACDLGVAMQLTNIARDVGEDAREGRLYLPLDWLDEVGLHRECILHRPEPSAALADLVKRLLREADALYVRSEAGIGAVPLSCRPGLFAARFIYAGIGTQLAALGHDSVKHRARTNGSQKLGWLFLSGLRAGATVLMPRSPVIHAAALPEAAFLVQAAARPAPNSWRGEVLLNTFARLKAQDLEAKGALIGGGFDPKSII